MVEIVKQQLKECKTILKHQQADARLKHPDKYKKALHDSIMSLQAQIDILNFCLKQYKKKKSWYHPKEIDKYKNS